MFDIGATEILVIAVIAIIVVGPKDLPHLLRKIGSFVSYVKKISSDFQTHIKDTVDETVKETGIKDIKDTVDDVVSYDWSEEDDKQADALNDTIMRDTKIEKKQKPKKKAAQVKRKQVSKKTTKTKTSAKAGSS